MPILGTVASSYDPPLSVVTGGTLSSDSTYYYRTFTASGELGVSNSALNCDVVMVAGGGSAANQASSSGKAAGGAPGGGGHDDPAAPSTLGR